MKSSLIVLLAALLMLTVVPSAMAKEIDRDYHESFDVKPGHRLLLLHGDGDVTITPWDRDVLDVKVRYRAKVTKIGLGGRAEFEAEFLQDDDLVRIIGREKSGAALGFYSHKLYEYSYTIRAPAYLELDLEGDDGDVAIENWSGPIHCINDDGDLELRDIRAATTELELEDGDLHVDRLQGELDVRHEDGDVALSECKLKRCRIEGEDGNASIADSEGNFALWSEDGDIEIQRTLAHSVEIDTEDGDVDLYLLKTPALDVDASSEDGDISIDLESGCSATFSIQVDDGSIRLKLPEAEIFNEDEQSVSGKIGDGSGKIRIQSQDGRVSLREKN